MLRSSLPHFDVPMRTVRGMGLLLLAVFTAKALGQSVPAPIEKNVLVPSNAVAARPEASPSLGRIADLARRIAMAETEDEADGILNAQHGLATPELAREILLEIVKMNNGSTAGETVLKVAHRLMRFTERAEMAPARGLALHALGIAHSSQSNWKQAERYYEGALTFFIRQGVEGRQDLIWTYRDLASTNSRRGDLKKARENFENSLRLASVLGDRDSIVQACHGLAAIHLKSRDHATAIGYLERALAAAEETTNKGHSLSTLSQITAAYLHQGRITKAIEALESAYKLAIESNTSARSIYLFHIATLYVRLGDMPGAYSRFHRVQKEADKAGDQPLKFLALLNIAQINEQYGHLKLATEMYERVILMANIGLVGEPADLRHNYVRGRAEALNRLAEIQVSRGELDSAVEKYIQNLEMLRSARKSPGAEWRENRDEAWSDLEADVHTRLGELYSRLGKKSEADSHFSEALSAAGRSPSELGSIDALLGLSAHEARNGEFLEAATRLQNAELLVRRIGRADQLIKLRTAEGEMFVKSGRLGAADLKFQEALRLSESLRSEVTIPDQRATYFANLVRPFDQYIDFLMERHAKEPDAGFDRRAFDVSERRRARALLDSLRAARADIRRGVDPSLLEEEERIRSRLNATALEHFSGIESATSGIVEDRTKIADPSKADLTLLLAELARVETAIRKQSPRYAELMQPRPLRVQAVQAMLDDDTVLLNYTLGEKKSFLWVISKSSLNSFVLPPKAKMEHLIKQTYAVLSDGSIADDPPRSVGPDLRELSRVLLGQAAELLGDRKIVVVADGALQYLPFSSLPDPRGGTMGAPAMLLSNEIQFAPSASVVSVLRQDLRDRKAVERSVAVFADPVFSEDDERLGGRKDARPVGQRSDEESITRDLLIPSIGEYRETGSKPNVARLPFSRREADAIFELAPATTSLKAVDFDASRARLSAIDLSGFQIVHFATHGILNSEQPELSGIVLSLVNEKGEPVNGFLGLNEIYNMNLNADLVVLSACQTALGREVRGEGLIGLTRGFMYAGSPRVIASLWKVDDSATAELMKFFYAKLLREKMRPSAALRSAKMEMRSQKRWSSPYYWAGFELQGDWR
jgi:CHAT domain-containing protein/tetratricopeptide (TPR) repeat protein